MKKCTYLFYICSLDTLWKLNGKKLINKADLLKSTLTDEWISDDNPDWTKIYIKNISDNNKVLAVNNGEVMLEKKEKLKAEHLWIKGEENAEGYFTLKNSGGSPNFGKFLTATSAGDFELKGK